MKTKMPYAQALQRARELVAQLKPACERIEIAGSLRRRRSEVGDIELVAIPRPDLFGNSQIDHRLLELGLKPLINGPKQKKLDLGDIQVDLFLCTSETWGVIFALRTGSAEFSKWLVTKRAYGGACPSYLDFRDGRIWRGDSSQSTPEEGDVFELLGVCWVSPPDREHAE